MTLSPGAGPSPVVAAGVVQIAGELRKAASIQEFLATPVLVPNVETHSRLTALDRAVIRDLRALAAVCHQPHDRLGTEQVLVRADQARRVPAVGLTRLASHSEDWAGVEFNRVIPQWLLAQRYTDDYDFYENQVAVQLVDRLRRYLATRIRDLTKLEHHLVDLGRYQKALEAPQSFWKRERLATLLGEAAASTQLAPAQLANVVDQLSKLRTAVNVLRGSPLYSRANRRVAIPFRLPRSNLLARDHRYYRTALLWEAWASRERDETAVLADNRREFPTAYVPYVMAIILRAARTLGLKPADASAPAPCAGPAELGTPDGFRLHVRMISETTIELSADGKPVMHVAALAENLTGSLASAQVEEALQRVFRNHQEARVPTVVAYPGEREERANLPPWLRRLAHWAGPSPSGPGAQTAFLGVVPVTPLEIESTERLARALRWAWYGAWLQAAYPPRIEVPARVKAVAGDWLRVRPGQWHLLRLPSAAEWERLRIDASDAVPRYGPSSGTGSRVAAIDDVAALLRPAEETLLRLTTCPLCREATRVWLDPLEDTFHCRCENCAGEWGTRICGSCTKPFPVLRDNDTVTADGIDDQVRYDNGDEIDARFGCDVLALPCPSFPDWSRFRCPGCGTCQGSPKCKCNLPDQE